MTTDRFGAELQPGSPVLVWALGDPDDIEAVLPATYLRESEDGQYVVQLDPASDDREGINSVEGLFLHLSGRGIDPQAAVLVDQSTVAVYGPPGPNGRVRLPAPVVEEIRRFNRKTKAVPPGLLSLLDKGGSLKWSSKGRSEEEK